MLQLASCNIASFGSLMVVLCPKELKAKRLKEYPHPVVSAFVYLTFNAQDESLRAELQDSVFDAQKTCFLCGEYDDDASPSYWGFCETKLKNVCSWQKE